MPNINIVQGNLEENKIKHLCHSLIYFKRVMKDFSRNIRSYFSQNGETFNDLNYYYFCEYTSRKTESLSNKEMNLNYNLLTTFPQKYFFEERNFDHKSLNYICQTLLSSLNSRKKSLEIADRRLLGDFRKKALEVVKTIINNDQSAKDSNEENKQSTSNNQNSNPRENSATSTNSTNSSNDSSNTFNFNSNNNGEDEDDDENNSDNNFPKSGIQKDKDGRFICSYCLQTFAQVNEYTRHMQNVHNEKVAPYPCHLCKKKFKIEACYWKHMHTHLSNEENLKTQQTTWSPNIKQENVEKTSLITFGPLQVSSTEQGIKLPSNALVSPTTTLNVTTEKPIKNFIIKTPNIVIKKSLHNNTNNKVVDDVASSSADAKGNHNLVEGVNVIDNVKGKKIVVYYCAQCNKSYNRQLLYDEHMRVHAGLKPFCCEICGRMFARESNLAGHRQSHKQSKVYRCKVCKVKFSIKQKLVLHEMVHDLEEPFKCHLCIARFVREPDLKEHLVTHAEYSGEYVNQTNNPAKPNQRDEKQMVSQPIIEEIILDENIICDSMDGQVVYSNVELPEAVYNNDGFLSSTISFLSGEELVQHKDASQELSGSNEGSGDASFILPPYNTSMQVDAKTNELILKQEVLSDDEKTTKPTDQEDQPTIAKNGERINDVTHYLTPSGKVRPYIFCEVCGQPYKLLREYHDHMRRHTGHKPYCCEVCGKTFHRSKNLSAHRYSHVEVKRHKCDVCGKSFPLSTRLKIHQRIHTGEKPYECELCHKRFIRRNDYMDHRRKHTGGNTCIHCNKKYSKLETLREHINDKHNKVKPIKCKLCDERFSYSVALYRHMKKHRGQEKDLNKKVHFCCLCNKSFTRPCLLKRHMFKTHPQHQEANEAAAAASE